MKKIAVIDLKDITLEDMSSHINQILTRMQQQGRAIIEFKILGNSLEACAVFIMYDEDYHQGHHEK